MKRPDNLDADTLWKILGEYCCMVGSAEGVTFADGLKYEKEIHAAADQFHDKYFSPQLNWYEKAWENEPTD